MGLKGSIYFLFWGSSEAAMGGRAAPVWRVYEPKKTGARSARARTRGQNPLVLYVLVIKLTKKTRRRVSRGRDIDGKIEDGEIEEGGCE